MSTRPRSSLTASSRNGIFNRSLPRSMTYPNTRPINSLAAPKAPFFKVKQQQSSPRHPFFGPAIICCSLLLFLPCLVLAQDSSYQARIQAYQQKLNQEYRHPESSPLPDSVRSSFGGLPFFPIDTAYRIMAEVQLHPDAQVISMATSSGESRDYRPWGELRFRLKGSLCSLTVYQSERLRRMPGFQDRLFLPFADATNGRTTYGGGRYLVLQKTEQDSLVLDFNKAYHPYCAYNPDYSCPIVPPRNRLDMAIPAGVRLPAQPDSTKSKK